jgi:hypothetical protein
MTRRRIVFLKLTAGGEFLFEDRHNFRAFKLVVEADQGRIADVRRAVAEKATLPDADTAWIFQGMLRRWPDVEHDEAWQQNFSAMIDKARPHGWINDEDMTIKAHVEWVTP